MKKYFVVVVLLSIVALIFAATMTVHTDSGNETFELDQITSITFGIGEIILSEDWESGNINTNVWNVVQTCSNTPLISSDYSHSGDYSLSMIDHEGNLTPIIQNLNQMDLTNGFIEFYFMENHIHSSGSSRMHLKNVSDDYESCDLSNILCSIFISADSTMYLYDVEADPIELLTNISLGQWYKIGINFNINDNTLMINVDNQLLYSGIFNPEFTDNVKFLEFSAYSYWSNGPEYYIDDIIISSE